MQEYQLNMKHSCQLLKIKFNIMTIFCYYIRIGNYMINI